MLLEARCRWGSPCAANRGGVCRNARMRMETSVGVNALCLRIYQHDMRARWCRGVICTEARRPIALLVHCSTRLL